MCIILLPSQLASSICDIRSLACCPFALYFHNSWWSVYLASDVCHAVDIRKEPRYAWYWYIFAVGSLQFCSLLAFLLLLLPSLFAVQQYPESSSNLQNLVIGAVYRSILPSKNLLLPSVLHILLHQVGWRAKALQDPTVHGHLWSQVTRLGVVL